MAAQTPSPTSLDRVAENDRIAMANAKVSAKAGNTAGIDHALAGLNRARPGTANWDKRAALLLLQLTDQLRNDGRLDLIPSLVARALAHSRQAEALATSARSRAAANALAGFINERYTGETSVAVAHYRLAMTLVPDRAVYKEAVDRLTRHAAVAAQLHANTK